MVQLIPRDVLALVVDLLTDRVIATVASRVPRDSSGEIIEAPLVVVDLVGHSRPSMVIDLTTVAVQAYALTSIDASKLCREVFALLLSAPELDPRFRAATPVGGPIHFPDPETRMPRWQCSVQINTRPQETA